jgi:hypothetical protein
MNNKFKSELYGILRKHDVNLDECYDILDEMFYETYNSSRMPVHVTKGNSE